MPEERIQVIADKIQSVCGHTFQNIERLQKALTHSSTGTFNYERLEFLGDRVLNLVIAEALFSAFPEEREGDLAKRHAALVRGKVLGMIAQEINLGECVILSEAEHAAGGAENANILGDVMEALFGALFLDSDLKTSGVFILALYGSRLRTVSAPPQDPKTALQEWLQGKGHPLPLYEIIEKEGPDHSPSFKIRVSCVLHKDGMIGEGTSKRQAEKESARALLQYLMSDE